MMNRVCLGCFIFASILVLSCCINQNEQGKWRNDLLIEKQLVKDKVIARYWETADSGTVPARMSPFVATTYDQNGTKHSLYPKALIYFNRNGDFEFLWDSGNKEAGKIGGTWYVHGGVLIFVLGKTYSIQDGVATQLRYLVKSGGTGLIFEEPAKNHEANGSSTLPIDGFTKIVTFMQNDRLRESSRE